MTKLTRYQQFYNALTGSHYYAENPKKDSTGKVEHGKYPESFTPHNIRNIFLSTTGAIIQYYVSVNSGAKVKSVQFERPYITENGQKMYDEKAELNGKSLIQALFSEIQFNCIENIVFFIGCDEIDGKPNGFMQKNIEALQKFAVSKAMEWKRLENVLMVNTAFTQDFIDQYIRPLKVDENVGRQLAENIGNQNVNALYIGKNKEGKSKRENGFLPYPALMPEYYSFDLEYTEENVKKEQNQEKYRLSKFFKDEQKRKEDRKQEIINQQKEAQRKALENQYAAFIDDLWLDVKDIYTDLYKDSVETNCHGILTPTGLYLYNKDKKEPEVLTTNIYINELANYFFNTFVGSEGVRIKNSVSLKELDTNTLNENNYFSRFHAYNIFGIIREGERSRKWDEVLPVIEKRFKTIALTYLKGVPQNELIKRSNLLKDKLTNCVVIQSFDRNRAISMVYKINGAGSDFDKVLYDNCYSISGKQTCKILNNDLSQNNVVSLFGVFDAEQFASEALFSYQAYASLMAAGKRPSLKTVAIGRSLNGTTHLHNLLGNDSRIIGIFAGSGSGKGVMTLGLLSAIVANKVPFIYLDFKPDMAQMLWGIEKSFKDSGISRSDGKECRILAIDAQKDMSSCSPVRGHLFGENKPEYLNAVPKDAFAVLPYLKLIQVYYALSKVRANKSTHSELGGEMVYAIFDEFQENINTNLPALLTAIESVAPKGKKKDEQGEAIIKYKEKIENFVEELAQSTGAFVNTNGRVSKCNAIYLGQNADYGIWKNPLARALYEKTSYRFFGRNGGKGSYAPANSGVIEEFVNNEKTFGYWTGTTGSGKVDNIKNWKVFKAYSVLNENDFNIDEPSMSGSFTSGVMNNVTSDRVRQDLMENVFVVKDANGNKTLREEVGFLGLVKKLSGFTDNQIADALSEGYEVIWKLFCKVGLDALYPDVESYLFDCSFESLYTMAELLGPKKRVQDTASGTNEAIFDNDFFDSSSPSNPPVSNVQPEPQRPTTNQGSFIIDGVDQNELDDQDEPEEPVRPQRPTIIPTAPLQPINTRPNIDPRGFNGVDENGSRTKFDLSKFDTNNPRDIRPYLSTREQIVLDGCRKNGFGFKKTKITIQDSPFAKYTSNSNTSTLMISKEMTNILLEDINSNVCPLDMIKDFAVIEEMLVINRNAYYPTFDEAFYMTIPASMREDIMSGSIAKVFNSHSVYKFKNLEELYFDNDNFAQGRARKEMGIGFRKKWNVLFRKFKLLQVIDIGQNIHYERENPDTAAEDSILQKFKDNPNLTYSKGGTFLDKVWDSKPVRILTGALGWTAGIQLAWGIASLLGPWGLVFGAIALTKTYSTIKNKNGVSNQSFQVSSDSITNGSTTNSSKKKKDT